MKKILITGASGFIGSFIVEKALEQGFETWAAMRKTSSHKYLNDHRIKFIEIDLSSEDKLIEVFKKHSFNYIVHAAGVTKCLNHKDFFKVNTIGTKNLVNAIVKTNAPIEKFIFISSLSVFGDIHEQQPYKEIDETDIPKPNTLYAKSKIEAEKIVKLSTLPYIILRPTGVYGPREEDYYLMVKSIKNHIDFAVGYKQQDITFIYVKDVVQAVFLAIESKIIKREYFLSDGSVYQSKSFSNIIHKELGYPWLIHITAPIWILKIITIISSFISRITKKTSPLNNDKYHILKQRNWRCNIAPACKELGYKPLYSLKKGVKLTIEWYKNNNWI